MTCQIGQGEMLLNGYARGIVVEELREKIADVMNQVI